MKNKINDEKTEMKNFSSGHSILWFGPKEFFIKIGNIILWLPRKILRRKK